MRADPKPPMPQDTPAHTHTYDPTLNPSVSNVFAAAAFRFGHTLVANQLESYDKVGARAGAVPITHTQFLPYAMYDNSTVEDYVRGLTTQPAQAFDSAFASELTGHLFQEQCGKSQSVWICKILKDPYPYPFKWFGLVSKRIRIYS